MRTLLCFPQGHCGSSSRLGSYSRKSPSSFPAEHSGDSRGWGRRGGSHLRPSFFNRLTCVQAALVAVGAAQAEAPVAGVTRLAEGRGGVDGVPPAPQHVGRVQELGVGHGLQKVGANFKTWSKISHSRCFCGHVCLRRLPTQLASAPSPFRRPPAPLLPVRSPSPWRWPLQTDASGAFLPTLHP